MNRGADAASAIEEGSSYMTPVVITQDENIEQAISYRDPGAQKYCHVFPCC